MYGFSMLDYVLLGVYGGIIFTLGAACFRKKSSAREFFLASRTAGPLAVGTSLMVSLASSLGYVAVPTAANRSGVMILWSLLALPLCYPVIAYVFIPFYQRLPVYTAYEYLEHRFGLSIRLLASGLFIAWRITWMGAVLYVPAMALNVASNGRINIALTVVTIGLLATIYSLLGGLRGVLWADKAQFLVMFGGIIVALATVCTQMPDGIAGVWRTAAAAGKLNWMASIPAWGDASLIERLRLYLYTDFTVPAIIISFTVGKLANYSVDQMLVQRFLSAKSHKAAVRGFQFNCIAFALFFTLMTLTGLAISSYAAGAGFPKGIRPDQVFPYYMAYFAPSGLAGLMFAGLVAAGVSSFDSGVNSCSTAFCNDFYCRLKKRTSTVAVGRSDDAELVRAGRLAVFGVGVASIAIGCVVGRMGDIFEIALKVVNSFVGPLLAIFLLAMFSRRATERGVLFGTIAGVVGTSLLVFATPLIAVAGHLPIGVASVVLPCVRALNVGFLWVGPLGLVFTFSAGYVMSLFARCPTPNFVLWSYRTVMRIPHVQITQEGRIPA